MQYWTAPQWVVAAVITGAAVVIVYLLVKELSAVASRAYFAEKEKHIKRVIETTKSEDTK